MTCCMVLHQVHAPSVHLVHLVHASKRCTRLHPLDAPFRDAPPPRENEQTHPLQRVSRSQPQRGRRCLSA